VNACGCDSRATAAGPSPAPSPQSMPAPQRRRLARDADKSNSTKAIDNDPFSLRQGKAQPNAPRRVPSANRTAATRRGERCAAASQTRTPGHRSHFNPNQPRVPAGNPDGGQWTSSGGGFGARLAGADKPRFGGGAALNGLWDLFGHKHGTVAFTTIDGTDIFGSNSGSPIYTSADRAAAISMRTIVVKKYPEVFSAERVGRCQMMRFSTPKQRSC
jgi:hypothetical protein